MKYITSINVTSDGKDELSRAISTAEKFVEDISKILVYRDPSFIRTDSLLIWSIKICSDDPEMFDTSDPFAKVSLEIIVPSPYRRKSFTGLFAVWDNMFYDLSDVPFIGPIIKKPRRELLNTVLKEICEGWIKK